MQALLTHAKELGVTVTHKHLGLLQGRYNNRLQLIELDPSLGEGMWARSVLAHELGHAWWRHTETTLETERQANEYAARLLIDPAEYAEAESVSTNLMYISQELHVSPLIIQAWQDFMMKVTT